MQRILVVGAGRSASTLIQYLLDHSEENDWQVIVGDYDLSLAEQKVGNHPNGKIIRFDVFDEEQRNDGIRNADIVVSMLPASMHILLAEDCVFQGKNMVTASYVSEDIAALNDKAVEKGVLLLNEIGLDPGIDHMSAKKVIDDIHNNGTLFFSLSIYLLNLQALIGTSLSFLGPITPIGGTLLIAGWFIFLLSLLKK